MVADFKSESPAGFRRNSHVEVTAIDMAAAVIVIGCSESG
jgi:hypothetical protein